MKAAQFSTSAPVIASEFAGWFRAIISENKHLAAQKSAPKALRLTP